MKRIIKTPEPISLVQHRAKKAAFYHNLPIDTKDELRQFLISEQCYICCYCMKRIPERIEVDGKIHEIVKIEHFQSQDHFQNLELSYSNLLAACSGNEGKPQKIQTCDTRKGNQHLNIKPTAINPNCETLFKYNAIGEISSINKNVDIDDQIKNVLNLNMETLQDARSEIYLQVQERVRVEGKRLKNDKAAFLRFLHKERNRWLERTDNKFKAYCFVAVYYLTKKIDQNKN